MKSHWSDGHLYSGDAIRKLQAKRYFLIADVQRGDQVFLTLYDAECYCMKHKLDPDEVIKSGDPEVYQRAISLAISKHNTLGEQAERLKDMLDKSYAELDRYIKVRDTHEQTNKRNFDREMDQENIIKAQAKSSGIYAAYKDTRERAFYYQQIVLLSGKP